VGCDDGAVKAEVVSCVAAAVAILRTREAGVIVVFEVNRDELMVVAISSWTDIVDGTGMGGCIRGV
jgi:hypothetical protein